MKIGSIIVLVIILVLVFWMVLTMRHNANEREQMCLEKGYEGARIWNAGIWKCYKVSGQYYIEGEYIQKHKGNWYFT